MATKAKRNFLAQDRREEEGGWDREGGWVGFLRLKGVLGGEGGSQSLKPQTIVTHQPIASEKQQQQATENLKKINKSWVYFCSVL